MTMQLQQGFTTGGMGLRAQFCTAATLNRSCPLWVKSRHSPMFRGCPLYPQNRTWISTDGVLTDAALIHVVIAADLDQGRSPSLRIVIDQECVNLLRPEARKDHINLAIGARVKDFNLPPNRHSCCPRVCDRGLSNSGIVWIDEHGKTCGLRQQLVQEPKQFARKLKVH